MQRSSTPPHRPRPRPLLAALLWLASSLLPALAAESPSSLLNEELVAATQAALEELTRLEAGASADRAAFEQSESDLLRAIARCREELPPRPPTLDQIHQAEREYIQEQLAISANFHKAWEQRRSRSARAAETLAALEELKADLRPAYEKLFDRMAALRPFLIEAQRRVERRTLKLEELKDDSEVPTVKEWIERSSQLASQRQELLAEIDQIVARYDAAKQSFDALEPTDQDTDRFARNIEIALSALAEAKAEAGDQRAEFAKLPVETIPSEVEKAVGEWKALLEGTEPLAEECGKLEKAYRDLIRDFDALEAPRREDVPAGDGLPEIRDARQNAELASRMITYYEKSLEIVEKGAATQNKLLDAIAVASEHQENFTRQSARVSAALEEARKLAKDWSAPEDVNRQRIWDEWRHQMVAELDRLELAREIRARLVDKESAENTLAQLNAQRENEKQARAQLETELGYAEFVSRMADDTDAELVRLLAPDGEIARNVTALEAEVQNILTQIDLTAEGCRQAVRSIQSVEDPYSRAVMTSEENKTRLQKIRELLESIAPGLPAEDREEALVAVKETPQVVLPEAIRSATGMDETELAKAESEFVRDEQSFTRIFLDYFLSIEASRDQLRDALERRQELDESRDEKLTALIAEEKRRYAAAREIQRRVRESRMSSKEVPEHLNRWLSRSAVRKATDRMRNLRRTSLDFESKAEYELERLQTLTSGTAWIRIRADAADARAALVGKPVSLLQQAKKPLVELSEVEQRNLELKARDQGDRGVTLFETIFARFTDPEKRDLYDKTRHTYYLELANRARVLSDLDEAKEAYEDMAAVCTQEKEDLAASKSAFADIVDLRLYDYRAARYAAGVALHPGSRSRIEEAFREKFVRDLHYRLSFREEDLDSVVTELFNAESRLRAARSLERDMEILLSKVGLEQEIGWYKSQIARIAALAEIQKSKEVDLHEKISGLRRKYKALLQENAVQGLGVVVVIPLIAFLLVRVLRGFSLRLERRLVPDREEDISDRHRRLKTISATSTAAISVLVWTIALVYMFAKLGLDITPIVASASVVGLAVAFGAQALIKDFFSGFFILLENQFTIGDIVTIGTISGTVERISLRTTILRDLQGVVHYVPNGSILQVSNKTQGWSRVVMEVSVGYQEDPDRVSEVLSDVLLEMAGAENWRLDIIEEPTVLGVENFTERAIDIRLMVKTRPGKQWAVARETRRRIKKRFDELGIEIPFPQRVVHHVYQGTEAPGPEAQRTSTEPHPED